MLQRLYQKFELFCELHIIFKIYEFFFIFFLFFVLLMAYLQIDHINIQRFSYELFSQKRIYH